MLAFFLKLLFKLPKSLLIRLSGKVPVVKGHRTLDAGFQFLLSYLEKSGSAGMDLSTSAAEIRKRFSEEGKELTAAMPSGVSTQDHQVGSNGESIRVREYSPDRLGAIAPALVYFHGGGWVVGSIETHESFTAFLAKELNARVFSVDYRLSPEYPYPIPLADCEAAFNWVKDNAQDLGVNPTRVSVGGDSAGGNLSAALCIKRQQEEVALPKAQLLIYPVTDLNFPFSSMDEMAESFLLTKEYMYWFREQYLTNEAQVSDPLVSPLLADNLEGQPSAVVVTAGFDPLRDEGDQYAQKLRQANVEIYHRTHDSYIHGFVNMEFVSGVDFALKRICDDFKKIY